MSQEIFFIYFGKKLDVRNFLSGRMSGNHTAAFKSRDCAFFMLLCSSNIT